MKECYWLHKEAKYLMAWGFWRKTNNNNKKLLHECGSSKLEASRTKNIVLANYIREVSIQIWSASKVC